MQICKLIVILCIMKLVPYGLHKKIAARMGERRLNQEALASGAKVDQGQISKILRGKFSRLSPNVCKICTFLGIELAEGASPLSTQEADQLVKFAREFCGDSPKKKEFLMRLLRDLNGLSHGKHD